MGTPNLERCPNLVKGELGFAQNQVMSLNSTVQCVAALISALKHQCSCLISMIMLNFTTEKDNLRNNGELNILGK